MEIHSYSLFRPGAGQPVRFGGNVSFAAAVFGSTAQFQDAEFHKRADFASSRFTLGAIFDRARFHGDADFTAATVNRDGSFRDTVFEKKVSFGGAAFNVLIFREEATEKIPKGKSFQFNGGVDLRGCVYSRIGVAWDELLSRLGPYDRQPYVQLEGALRATGDDRAADDVYYRRRWVERKNLWSKTRDWPRAFFDSLHWLLARYGVRPYRLLAVTALVVLFGMAVFRAPGAVTHRELALRVNDPYRLSWMQALGMSVNQFLPVDIPSGRQWLPTTKAVPLVYELFQVHVDFAAYAMFHRLVGWVLVPLGIAALTGLLHRRRGT